MAWLIIAGILVYIGCAAYLGRRFRGWLGNTYCSSRRSGRIEVCNDCGLLGAWAYVFWPIIPPLWIFITSLYRTAARQSSVPREQRQQDKLDKRRELAEAERAAVAAEQAAAEAKLTLAKTKQELAHANSMLTPDIGSWPVQRSE